MSTYRLTATLALAMGAFLINTSSAADNERIAYRVSSGVNEPRPGVNVPSLTQVQVLNFSSRSCNSIVRWRGASGGSVFCETEALIEPDGSYVEHGTRNASSPPGYTADAVCPNVFAAEVWAEVLLERSCRDQSLVDARIYYFTRDESELAAIHRPAVQKVQVESITESF